MLHTIRVQLEDGRYFSVRSLLGTEPLAGDGILYDSSLMAEEGEEKMLVLRVERRLHTIGRSSGPSVACSVLEPSEPAAIERALAFFNFREEEVNA